MLVRIQWRKLGSNYRSDSAIPIGNLPTVVDGDASPSTTVSKRNTKLTPLSVEEAVR
jgi:hypothetical protein